MKISFDWLKDHVEIPQGVEEIGAALTASGLEVEGIEKFESVPGGLAGVIVGEVLTCEKHPDADKLSCTTVDLGEEEPSPIVCGAPNVAAGQKVLVATVGTVLYTKDGDSFKIKKAKIRGQVSEGMICAEDELGLGTSHDGIMVLDSSIATGTPAADVLNISNDSIFEIGLTPNRAEGASHYGTARDIKAVYGTPLNPLPSELSQSSNEEPIKVSIENNEACPRYSSVLLKDVKVGPSPDWLANRLKSIGLAPINNVVDITNFILHDLGQPLHAFDADKITSKEVKIKTLAEGTEFVTLDEEKRKLAATDLMICNGDEPMCIAGVFGGIDSGVTESTTSVFLESAYFSADWVRRTSLKHTLKTDAAFRFERGTDPEMTIPALSKAANLIIELTGATVASVVQDNYGSPIQPHKVSVSYNYINKLIGIEIAPDKVKSILGGLDIAIVSETDSDLDLEVPPYRVDVQRPADIVEEILRIYGYDNIEVDKNLKADFLAQAAPNDFQTTLSTLGDILSGKGFQEIITNSLTNPNYSLQSNSIDESINIEILNKLSEDLGVMRQSLLFTGLEVIQRNVNRRQRNLKLFETGKTYRQAEEGYSEQQELSIFITGDAQEESWAQKTRSAEFRDLTEAISLLLDKLGISKFQSATFSNDLYSAGVELRQGNQVLAKYGQLTSKTCKAVQIKQKVFAAEINLDLVLKRKQKSLTFQEISKFPEVRRDLSIVLDRAVTFKEIEALAKKTERNLLKDINVFDVYEGENIDEGKKSYSVSFTLQDHRNTLTDKVIDKTMARLMAAFENDLSALIRK